MGNDEYTWSKKEKELARKIFDKAYQKEMIQIKDEIIKLISRYKAPKDIWKLHDYLTDTALLHFLRITTLLDFNKRSPYLIPQVNSAMKLPKGGKSSWEVYNIQRTFSSSFWS